MDWKKIIKRGLIIAVVICGIALVGGIAQMDIVILAPIVLLVLILAALMTIIHNQKGDKK